MSIDAVYRSRRYEPPTEPEAAPVNPAARPSKRREASELEHPIRYPRELFEGGAAREAGLSFEKKPGVFGRTAPHRADGYERITHERPPAVGGTTTITGAKVYTNATTEIGVAKTKLSTPEMVALIRKHWSDLTEEGARTLAAQWAAETGFGQNCYSFNFGNVKCIDPKQGHMYLAGVWEVPKTDAEAAKMRAAGGRDADDAFKKKLGLPPNMRVIVFEPPHPASRFRAFMSADEGMAFWVGFKKNIAAKHPEYLDALNRGDIATAAHVLAKAKYATAPEAMYRDAMIRCRRTIDGQLGAAS